MEVNIPHFFRYLFYKEIYYILQNMSNTLRKLQIYLFQRSYFGSQSDTKIEYRIDGKVTI
jgi:hypothetical protein